MSLLLLEMVYGSLNLALQITARAFLSKYIIITYYWKRDRVVITGIIAQMMTCQLEKGSCSKWMNKLTQIKGVSLAKLGARQGHNYHIFTRSDNPVALRWEQVVWNRGTSCWSWTTVQLFEIMMLNSPSSCLPAGCYQGERHFVVLS